jgi:hypothetical protein
MARINSLNINRLSKYNFKYISLEEVVILEYLFNYYQKKSLEVVVFNRIELETGLKRSRIISACQKLEEKGFITITTESLRKRFEINFDKIEAKLDVLFLKNFKYGRQFIYYIQNPNAFKTRARKGKLAKVIQNNKKKSKTEETPVAKQMSLF